MKKLVLTIFLFLIPIIAMALTRTPEDYLGRVPIPMGVETDILKFKTDQIVYAGTNGGGLYVSYDAGTNWIRITTLPDNVIAIRDIIIVNNVLFIASYGSGIYSSTDNGNTWVAKNSGLTSLNTQCIAATSQGKLICGTYGKGIFYSNDNGNNWIRTDKGLRYDNISSIQVMKNGYIVAGSYGGGFYVSRDTCKTWLVSNTQLKNLFINDLSMDITGKIYAATNGSGVMFTGDGITWINYSNQWHKEYDNFTVPLLDTAVTATGVNQYQTLMGTRSAGMYFWDDLWNGWASTGPLSVGITSCAVSPNGTILATRSYGDVIRSTDNGATWKICSKKIVDIDLTSDYSPTFLNVFTSDFNDVIVGTMKKGTTQRISISLDHGNSWKYLNSISTSDIFDIEITNDTTIYVANEDGLHKYNKISGAFDLILENSAETASFWRIQEVEYNQQTKTVLAIYQLLEPADPSNPPPDPPWKRLEYRLYKSVNGGAFTYVTYADKSINSLQADLNGDIFMAHDASFKKSTDNGASFNTLFANQAGTVYGKDGSLYRYTLDNKIYKMINKSGTWNQISFTPEILVPDDSWEIQRLGGTVDGKLYVAIRIQVPGQGYMYELYVNDGAWKTVKGCYTMDKIRTIASDYNGYTYFVTNALYKEISSKYLKAPIIVAPKDAIKGEEINPILKWKTAKFAEEYELQIAPNDLFDSPFETNVTGDTTCKIVLDLAYNQEYYWRIRSKTHSALSSWAVGSFTIGLEPPKLKSPEKGKVGVPLAANLIWHKIPDATHYQIQVAKDIDFNTIVFEKNNHPDTTITTDKLTGLQTYYWRVKAYTSSNISRWSEVWDFKTVLGPPTLVYPVNNSIDRLLTEEFKWKKAATADSYYLQIAKDDLFSNIFFEGNVGADTFEIIQNMLPETEYYWHVASVNNEGTSDYSDVWKFSTSLRPISLEFPVNKAVNIQRSVKFYWQAHNAGNKFQIQISKTNDFKTPVVDETVNNVLEYQTNKLEYYQDYFWRVRLVVNNRFGLWSEIWSFKTGIETTSLLNPPDKSVDQVTALKFKWYPVVGANFYQLQISKNDVFTDLVYSTDSIIKNEQYVDDLEPEVHYFWRVRAWNIESYGTSQWSDTWTFTTGQVTLLLRNPKDETNNYKIPSLLTWFSASTAEYYHLQVAKDADFKNIAFEKDSIYDTKFELSKTQVEVSTLYFWRVKGVSQEYTTPWSDIWKFTTASTSIKESTLFESISVYPNPTNKEATLNINYPENCEATLIISTEDAKILHSEKIFIQNGDNSYSIPVSNLTNGAYYLTIISPSGYITKELIIVK